MRLPNSRASSSHIREEDELHFGSQSSLLSSNSGGQPLSAEEEQERPLSAENLLPEPNIASMTSSAAADRLSSVMQSGFMAPASKCLTRQQTFPPLQPYVRMRYMSTTAEMTSCTEALLEGDLHFFFFRLFVLVACALPLQIFSIYCVFFNHYFDFIHIFSTSF